MNLFKKIIFIFLLTASSVAMFDTKSYAANIFGIKDPPGCESKDIFLPVLVICGRNPATGACSAYSQPCSLGDLVETGSRALVWFISVVLLIIPIIIMYYGAKIIIYGKDGIGGGKMAEVRKRFWIIILYFILMLSGWLIVRTVVDIFQVRTDGPNPINTFLIDENGQKVKARTFNTN